jgi:hypothetical protein
MYSPFGTSPPSNTIVCQQNNNFIIENVTNGDDGDEAL